MTANGYRDSFSGDKIVLKLIVVMYTQLYEHTKKSFNCTLKWVYYTVCESINLFKKLMSSENKEHSRQITRN